MDREAMSKDTALMLLKEIKNYITSGNPVWATQDVEDAMDAAIEALRAKGAVDQLMQKFADSAIEFYAKGYNVAKREIALSGEYERAYQRGKADATKWIPCSERLPSKGVPVLVNGIMEDAPPMIITDPSNALLYYEKGWINAWMPLPEPYKAESEEK